MTNQQLPADILDRIRACLPPRSIAERRMFGGVTFLLNGNMLCCISPRGLMVRVGKEGEAEALSRPHAAPCLGAGRRMAGFILVRPAGFDTDANLRAWLDLARSYVESLPPKLHRTASDRPARRSRTKAGRPARTPSNRKGAR